MRDITANQSMKHAKKNILGNYRASHTNLPVCLTSLVQHNIFFACKFLRSTNLYKTKDNNRRGENCKSKQTRQKESYSMKLLLL